MKTRISISLVLLGLLVTIAFGQEESNPRLERKNGIILSGAGPGLYGGISYDYFIQPNIDIEVGAGPVNIFAGVKYHFGGHENKNWTPYIGGYALYIWIFDIFDDDDNESPAAFYVPVGLQFSGSNGFTFAAELAGKYGVGEFFEWGSVKVGYRF